MRWRASLAVALLLPGCGGGPRPASGGYRETGVASWYGAAFAGRPTASGERFDPAGLTAAHRTLPLGSLAEVTALQSGRAIVVRINDRGPRPRDRLIDLSQGAARLLGTERTLARVRVRALPPDARTRPGLLKAGRPSGTTAGAVLTGRYWLQVATFADGARARALAERLGGEVIPSGTLWRVRLGPLRDATTAQRARDAVVVEGYGDAQLIPIP